METTIGLLTLVRLPFSSTSNSSSCSGSSKVKRTFGVHFSSLSQLVFCVPRSTREYRIPTVAPASGSLRSILVDSLNVSAMVVSPFIYLGLLLLWVEVVLNLAAY